MSIGETTDPEREGFMPPASHNSTSTLFKCWRLGEESARQRNVERLGFTVSIDFRQNYKRGWIILSENVCQRSTELLYITLCQRSPELS